MKLGFIGIGNMGRPMAANLAHAGHNLTVYDTNPKAVELLLTQCDASGAKSPAAVARGAEVIFLSLPTPAIVEGVIRCENGVLAGLGKKSVIVDLSTVTPNTIRRLHPIVEKAGGAILEAPVSGGVSGAESGQLTIMVGGDKDVFKRCLPLLEIIGKNIFFVGGPGSGNAVKIINQYLFAANLAALCEALTLADTLQLDQALLFDILEKSSGNSYAVKTRREKLLKRSFEPGFQLQLMLKDLGLYDECARDEGFALFVGDAVRRVYAVGNRKGYGGNDLARVYEAIETITGGKNRGKGNICKSDLRNM